MVELGKIRAPFNFVPLSDKVFYPEWANQISHDVPFKDGLSGSVEYTIIAESPIYVRNGQAQNADIEKDNSFSHIGNQYFIPATSMKGAIRNVLEIMSFSKMTNVQDQSFGLRDLHDDLYLSLIKKEIHCGWLKLDGDGAKLEDCGIPWRISMDEIDRILGTNLSAWVKRDGVFNRDENKTAQIKYKQVKDSSKLQNMFSEPKKDKFGKLVVRYEKNGQEGTIVFTGQPSQRKIKK